MISKHQTNMKLPREIVIRSANVRSSFVIVYPHIINEYFGRLTQSLVPERVVPQLCHIPWLFLHNANKTTPSFRPLATDTTVVSMILLY
jgi:hypothetical protein